MDKEQVAGLLKEVGEPVLYTEFAEDGGWLGDTSECADHLEEPHALFTSDQLAAAILKATKPLEEEITRREEYQASAEQLAKVLNKQLAKAEQLWQLAQGRCDALEDEVVKWREASRVKHIEAIDWAGKHQAISYELDELRAQLAAAQEEIADLKNTIKTRDFEVETLYVRRGENEELKDQLAKAEQRVAEACAALIEDRLGELDGQDSEWAAGQVGAIGEIADGGWRKFVKEV